MRPSVRPSLTGERLLYLDEIQSDWHARNARASRDPTGSPPVVPAPFAKEWPLVALKAMIWWGQQIGADAVAISPPGIRTARWFRAAPERLYSETLPGDLADLARTLGASATTVSLTTVRPGYQLVPSKSGWSVRVPPRNTLSASFPLRNQTEHFARLIGGEVTICAQSIDIRSLPKITGIPLYGLGEAKDWYGHRRKEPARTPSVIA